MIVLFELNSKSIIVISKACCISFSFLACTLQTVAGLLDLMLFLFDFVEKAFNLGLMKVFEFVLVFAVLTEEIVSYIIVFCLHKV